jgi:hypothetical protein
MYVYMSSAQDNNINSRSANDAVLVGAVCRRETVTNPLVANSRDKPLIVRMTIRVPDGAKILITVQGFFAGEIFNLVVCWAPGFCRQHTILRCQPRAAAFVGHYRIVSATHARLLSANVQVVSIKLVLGCLLLRPLRILSLPVSLRRF